MGGVLILSFPCLNSEHSPDQIRCSDVVFSEAKNLLILEGVLTEDDEKTLVIPEYYRSKGEVKEVLNSKEMRELWQVKEFDTMMIEDPWLAALEKKDISKKKMCRNAKRRHPQLQRQFGEGQDQEQGEAGKALEGVGETLRGGSRSGIPQIEFYLCCSTEEEWAT